VSAGADAGALCPCTIAVIATAIKVRIMEADCGNRCLQVFLLSEIFTCAQDPIPASLTDSPREAEQNPMKTLTRNVQFPALKLCPILRLHWEW